MESQTFAPFNDDGRKHEQSGNLNHDAKLISRVQAHLAIRLFFPGRQADIQDPDDLKRTPADIREAAMEDWVGDGSETSPAGRFRAYIDKNGLPEDFDPSDPHHLTELLQTIFPDAAVLGRKDKL